MELYVQCVLLLIVVAVNVALWNSPPVIVPEGHWLTVTGADAPTHKSVWSGAW